MGVGEEKIENDDEGDTSNETAHEDQNWRGCRWSGLFCLAGFLWRLWTLPWLVVGWNSVLDRGNLRRMSGDGMYRLVGVHPDTGVFH